MSCFMVTYTESVLMRSSVQFQLWWLDLIDTDRGALGLLGGEMLCCVICISYSNLTLAAIAFCLVS